MATQAGLFALLHILVFVYWLGGDLGAYYASFFATDSSLSLAQRSVSLAILNGVDTAPAIALILALPTGVALACARGWIAPDYRLVVLLAVLCLVWLRLALYLHSAGVGGAASWKTLDTGLRIAVLLGLTALGVLGLSHRGLPGIAPLPLFMALKCLLLATCFGLGLMIRRYLRPLLAGFAELQRRGGTPAIEAGILGAMNTCRGYVLAIWACLLGAAAAGIFKPL